MVGRRLARCMGDATESEEPIVRMSMRMVG